MAATSNSNKAGSKATRKEQSLRQHRRQSMALAKGPRAKNDANERMFTSERHLGLGIQYDELGRYALDLDAISILVQKNGGTLLRKKLLNTILGSSQEAGGVLTWNTDEDDVAVIAPSTPGRVLRDNGSGNLPSWVGLAALAISHGVLTNLNANDHPHYLAEIGTTPPGVPYDGQLWYDTSTTSVTNDRVAVTSQATTYTILNTDYVVLCDASAGAFTATLPSAVGLEGKRFYVKKADTSANAVTVDADGAETIDKAASIILLSPYDSVGLVSDNVEWWIL